MKTLEWRRNELIILDQTKLPAEETYRRCTSWQDVKDAISVLAVRGAPAIGVAAAYGLVLGASELLRRKITDTAVFSAGLATVAAALDAARPTAVNLHWALTRMLKTAEKELAAGKSSAAITLALEREAVTLHAKDIEINRSISAYGAAAIIMQKGAKKLTVLTHCNAGALATADIGTALGVIRTLHKRGLIERVYADETRPLLQGARLTVTELKADGIPVTLITDSTAGWVMKTGRVDAVIVGADRITANGDTANKIGTYSVSVLAKEHRIPFYVAAPLSTFDLSMTKGEEIPIEERHHDEVRRLRDVQLALADADVFNPAFDVTPHQNIEAIFTEKGTIEKPSETTVSAFFRT